MPEPPAWGLFRPGEKELEALGKDVEDIKTIQTGLKDKHPGLKLCDRVAHQYQLAGRRVKLDINAHLPADIRGIGLFIPASQSLGVGRISTGLGTPHIETNPDFPGLMLAFETRDISMVPPDLENVAEFD